MGYKHSMKEKQRDQVIKDQLLRKYTKPFNYTKSVKHIQKSNDNPFEHTNQNTLYHKERTKLFSNNNRKQKEPR